MDAQLAMSRAFGDGDLKEHITSEPDININKIDTDAEFIILASDGLWKVSYIHYHIYDFSLSELNMSLIELIENFICSSR